MDKKSISARIKALLSKTTENGCTEAEAMSAAVKARELMDTYNIELGAVGMEAEGTAKAQSPDTSYKTLGIKWRVAMSIAAFCDVKVWRGGKKLTFFGLQSDADFATWLAESLDGFIQRAAINYMTNINPRDLNPSFKMPRWEAEKAFVMGAIKRISQRLDELTAARGHVAAPGSGTSLVVVKGALVERAFRALDMKLRSGGSSYTQSRDGGSYAAGQAAGDRASFGRPVNGGGAQRLIGN